MHIFITPVIISAVARDVYTLYEKAGYDTTTTKQVYKGGYMVKVPRGASEDLTTGALNKGFGFGV